MKNSEFLNIFVRLLSPRQERGSVQAQVERDGLIGRKTNVIWSAEDWYEKFQDHFSDVAESTETSYKSPKVSIEISSHTYESDREDMYGSTVSYVLADIYISDITCLQAVFAQNMYGVGYDEELSEMAARNNALCIINGDSYGNDMHTDNGTIIRNGIIYRAADANVETCVINWDGTMEIYPAGQLDVEELIARGAYQSWIFGPSLLDEEGKAKDHFVISSYIRQAHPRTAIGYYEPGHYCFLVADGRQWDYARGMYLDEMAQLFEDLGCTMAYNLDGGRCSLMMLEDKLASHPYYWEEFQVQDGIFITEGI